MPFADTEPALLSIDGRLYLFDVPCGATRYRIPPHPAVPPELHGREFDRVGEDEIMRLPLFRRRSRQL